MPQEEVDLLQLSSQSMAEPSTGPSQVVWRQLRHADALGGFLHNEPNRFTVMPSPHVLPTLLTRRNSFPRSIPAAASQSSSRFSPNQASLELFERGLPCRPD